MKKIIAVVLLVIVISSLMAACEADNKTAYYKEYYSAPTDSGPWSLDESEPIDKEVFDYLYDTWEGTECVSWLDGTYYKESVVCSSGS